MLPDKHKKIVLPYLINECILGNRQMQELLYDKFATIMYYQCLRFIKNPVDAEDVLQEGFIKVFANLHNYKNEGSFEGWVRKIMIRTALSYLRDNKKYTYHIDIDYAAMETRDTHVFDTMAEKDIMGLVAKLPSQFKRIFSLHVIEGYNHREVAEILGCTESTSKSQFYRFRIRLQKILKQSA